LENALAATPVHERERNGARTRQLVLDAAERLFAARGFDGASLTEVGAEAGVSRGTPGYFFGSKAELYQAVIHRCFEGVRRAIRSGKDRALASGEQQDVALENDAASLIAAIREIMIKRGVTPPVAPKPDGNAKTGY